MTKLDDKEDLKSLADMVAGAIDSGSSELSRKFFRKNADEAVQALKSQALLNDKKLADCRVPFDQSPTGDGWYIHPGKVPPEWHSSLVTDAQTAAESKLHRRIVSVMGTLYKEKYIQKLLHNRFTFGIFKKTLSNSLSQLSLMIAGYDIKFLQKVLHSLPTGSEFGSVGIKLATSVSSELALSLALKEDITREYTRAKVKAGVSYGGKEIPTRLEKSLTQTVKVHATRITIQPGGLSRLMGGQEEYKYRPHIFMTSDERTDFTSLLALDPNFFRCPTSTCGFDANFTQACIKARQTALHEMEQQYLDNYLMSTLSQRADEKEGLIEPIHQLIARVRTGQPNSPLAAPIADPLKAFLGSDNW